MTGTDWVLLAYRMPREPSTPRISVWRRLRRLGVAQILDGLVTLPAGANNREQLEWVADAIVEAGGEAQLWLARPSSVALEETLRGRMTAAVAAEYRELAATAAQSASDDDAARLRTIKRLRRELNQIEQRDYFPPPEREAATNAIQALTETTVGVL